MLPAASTNTAPAIAHVDGHGTGEIIMFGSMQNAAQSNRERGVALWVVGNDGTRPEASVEPLHVPDFIDGRWDRATISLRRPTRSPSWIWTLTRCDTSSCLQDSVRSKSPSAQGRRRWRAASARLHCARFGRPLSGLAHRTGQLSPHRSSGGRCGLTEAPDPDTSVPWSVTCVRPGDVERHVGLRGSLFPKALFARPLTWGCLKDTEIRFGMVLARSVGTMRRRVQTRVDEGSRSEVLLRRARRHLRRGEVRKAVIAARQACYQEQCDPRLWALYASYCWKAGHTKDACDALRQAIWYRQRARDARRTASLKMLLEKLEHGILPSAA